MKKNTINRIQNIVLKLSRFEKEENIIDEFAENNLKMLEEMKEQIISEYGFEDYISRLFFLQNFRTLLLQKSDDGYRPSLKEMNDFNKAYKKYIKFKNGKSNL